MVKPIVVQLVKNFPAFVEHDDSLPHPEAPASLLNAEPDELSPHSYILFLQDYF
jgi:hypothetical protein